MVTVISLVTISVAIILGVLNSYFSKRVDSAFHDKLRAQKGQVEILINNRLADIRNTLRNLADDNAIRVTVMLGAQEQLSESISQTYPSGSGAYYFIQKYDDKSIYPSEYPGLSSEFIVSMIEKLPYEEIFRDGFKTRLLWILMAPVRNTGQRMGTAYALYDLVEDKELIKSMQAAGEGEVSILRGPSLFSLASGKMHKISIDPDALSRRFQSSDFITFNDEFALSRVGGYQNLYFLNSLKGLGAERSKITLLMGLFSALILIISTFIAIFFSNRMVRPLREMTEKAIKISDGGKELKFEEKGNFWEFAQLSQAFNYMLANLKEAEERSRYKELLENVDDAVYIIDKEGRILDANAAAYNRLGYFKNEFLQLDLAAMIPDAEARRRIEALHSAIPGQGNRKLNLETVHLKKDGSSLAVEILSHAIEYRGQHVVLNVARDISRRIEVEEEKKSLESQLIHAQKMEAIGTLAGGVAHDFNNLLMGMQGRLSMIRMVSEPDQSHYRHIDQIEQGINSAADLTKQLLGFARKGKYEIRPTRINTLVEDSTRLFIRTRKEIKLKTDFEKDLWTAKVDRGQIEQVLINFYVNAWQAMPDGGDLTVKTRNVHLDEAYCRSVDVCEGDYTLITVSDTGTGMDAKTMERIFEPFFTTKGVGKGTGLGLASAYGIIRNHKGFIQVESEKGRGSTFKIYLPASPDESASEANQTEAPQRGRGTILVVDDEKESIDAAEVMLNALGYDVIRAQRGDEAIRLYRENMGSLDLITLDAIMPEMSGKEVYCRLKELNPDIRVLLVSGYGQNNQVEEIMSLGCNGFLQKPYDIHLLSRKVSEAMTGQLPKTPV